MRTMLACPPFCGEPATPAGRSGPGQDLLTPGVKDAQREHRDEDRHLDDRGRSETRQVEHDRPGKEKNGLYGEKDVKVRIYVVTDLCLSPVAADRVDPALVRDELARRLRRTARAK